MESLILQFVSLTRKPSRLTRYGVNTLFVLVAFLLSYGLERRLHDVPFLLFIPAVFAAALIFDRGSGFYATALSAIIAWWFFVEPMGSLIPEKPEQLLSPVLFAAIGCAIAFVIEALRLALERATAADHGKVLLLHEINHRVRNDLQSITSTIAWEQRRSTAPEVGEKLQRVADRVQLMNRVYSRLTRRDSQSVVATQSYLKDLVADLRAVHFARRPVTLEARIEDTEVSLDCATALGLMVNELVTNAVKHAFPDDRAGRIEVILQHEGEGLILTVADDGIGAVAGMQRKGGLGHHLIQGLVQQFEGGIEITGEGGTRVTVRLPKHCALPASGSS